MTISKSFSSRVLTWYEQHGRKDLPWQQDVTFYRVWVSEIMLQQTQVNTVIPYFEYFMQRFPSVRSLADADLDDVLACWSGLGYYARARNLHKAAQILCRDYNGRFPADYDQAMALPGIGRSTAGAILAIVSKQRHPILDGNVKRVLTRHQRIEGWPGNSKVEARLWQVAEELTPQHSVNHYTQAMMDLGAMVCARRQPACIECPVAADCDARALGVQHALPHSKPRTPLPARQTAMIMVQNSAGEVLLERRPTTGIWGGLWSFPEVSDEQACKQWCRQALGFEPNTLVIWATVRHTFSHFQLTITPVLIEGPESARYAMEGDRFVWYNINSLPGGVAAPVGRLLQRLRDC